MKMAKALLMALGATLLAVGVQLYLNPDTPGWAVGILFAVLMNILPAVIYLVGRMQVLKDGWEFIPINPDYSKTESKQYCNAPAGAVCDKICYKCTYSKLLKFQVPDISGRSVPVDFGHQPDTDKADGEPYAELAKKYEDVEYAPSSSPELRKAVRRAVDTAEPLRDMTPIYDKMKVGLKRLASGEAMLTAETRKNIATTELSLRMAFANDLYCEVLVQEIADSIRARDKVAVMGQMEKSDIDCAKSLPDIERPAAPMPEVKEAPIDGISGKVPSGVYDLILQLKYKIDILLSKHHPAHDEFNVHTHLPSGFNGETVAAIHGIMQKAHDECQELINVYLSDTAPKPAKDDIVLNDVVEFFKCSTEECKVIGINHTYRYCALQNTKDAACSCSEYVDDDGHEQNIYIKNLKLIRKGMDADRSAMLDKVVRDMAKRDMADIDKAFCSGDGVTRDSKDGLLAVIAGVRVGDTVTKNHCGNTKCIVTSRHPENKYLKLHCPCQDCKDGGDPCTCTCVAGLITEVIKFQPPGSGDEVSGD